MGELAGDKWLPRDVAKLCHDHGWADDHLVLMVATIGGESAYYSEAVGDPHPDGTIDLGMFQLNSIHASAWNMTDATFKVMAFDPYKAVSYARGLFDAAGHVYHDPFQPWAAYENGGYKIHMRQAIVGVANMFAVMHGMAPAVRWGK